MVAHTGRTRKVPRRDVGRPRGAAIEAVLLARALEEVLEHGIEAASVDRIAQAAEVNKTSVYRRFGTREALVAAALERFAGDVGVALSDQGSLRADLGLVARHVAELLGEPVGRSLARAAFAESADSTIAALAARKLARPRAAALAMVRRARARGEWRTATPPDVVLAALVGALLHRALLERAPLTPRFVDQIVDFVAAGVMAGEADARRTRSRKPKANAAS